MEEVEKCLNDNAGNTPMKNEAKITEDELAGTARAMLKVYDSVAIDVARLRSIELKRMCDQDAFLKWRLIVEAIRCAESTLVKVAK